MVSFRLVSCSASKKLVSQKLSQGSFNIRVVP